MNPKGPYLRLEKERENFCAVLTNSIERAREFRKFHFAVVQRRLRNVVRKKLYALAKSLFCQIYRFFAVLVVFAVVLAQALHCCHPEFLLPCQRDVTLSSLLDLFTIFFCRFRCRRRLALLSVSVIHGPFNLEKVLNFTSRLEKSLNSV